MSVMYSLAGLACIAAAAYFWWRNIDWTRGDRFVLATPVFLMAAGALFYKALS